MPRYHAIHLKTGGFSHERNPLLRIELASEHAVGDTSHWLDLPVPDGLTVDDVAGKMVGFTDLPTWNAACQPLLESSFSLEAWLDEARITDPPPVFCCYGLPMIRRFLLNHPVYRPELAGEGWLDGIIDLNDHARLLKTQGQIPDAKLSTLLAHYRVEVRKQDPVALQVLRLARAVAGVP